MSFFDLNNDVKTSIFKYLVNDMKIITMFMSKHYDFQKLLFGEIVFDEEKYITKMQNYNMIKHRLNLYYI